MPFWNCCAFSNRLAYRYSLESSCPCATRPGHFNKLRKHRYSFIEKEKDDAGVRLCFSTQVALLAAL